MQTDPYHFVYTSEIFQKTNCIWHENSLLDFLRSILTSQGYTPKNQSCKSWTKQNQTVIICLVDDFATCADNFMPDTPYLFDSNTIVITDNHLTCPAQYKVLELPSSFFGIYHYQPEYCDYQPDKRFSLSINRIDIKRISILLEIVRHSMLYYPEPKKLDLINCNFLTWNDKNILETDQLKNFEDIFAGLESDLQSRYDQSFLFVKDNFELYNHADSLEQLSLSANINLVLETYSGENNIAVSEKIFRALQTSSPWMTFAGRYTVAYLNSLGFDVLTDLVPHRYDKLTEHNKVIEFIAEAAHTAFELSKLDTFAVKNRAAKAAEHNQRLLADYKTRWPREFARWLDSFTTQLK